MRRDDRPAAATLVPIFQAGRGHNGTGEKGGFFFVRTCVHKYEPHGGYVSPTA